MASGHKDAKAGGLEIPDLEIPPAPRARQTAPRPAVAPAGQPARSAAPANEPAPPRRDAARPEDYFGSNNFDSEHFGAGEELSIETARAKTASNPTDYFGSNQFESAGLDTDSPAGSIELGGSAGDAGLTPDTYFGSNTFGDDDDSAQLIAPSSARQEVASAPAAARRATTTGPQWPTGCSPDPGEIRFDAAEVALAADYGDSPRLAPLAPVYTWRVLSRKKQLRARIKELEVTFQKAERERDELLASLVRELGTVIEAHDETAALLAPVRDADHLAEERRSALAGTNAEYAAAVNAWTRQSTELDGRVAEKRNVEQLRRQELLAQTATFERAEAKNKRLYIEVRGIVELADKSGGKLPVQQSARVRELEAQIAAHKPELESARADAARAEAALAEAQNELRNAERERRALETRRSELDKQFQRQIGARSASVEQAEHSQLEAIAAVARKVLSLCGAVPVPKETLETVAKADARVARQLTELVTHQRAFESYDRSAYQRGWIVAIAALLALILVIVLSVVLS